MSRLAFILGVSCISFFSKASIECRPSSYGSSFFLASRATRSSNGCFNEHSLGRNEASHLRVVPNGEHAQASSSGQLVQQGYANSSHWLVRSSERCKLSGLASTADRRFDFEYLNNNYALFSSPNHFAVEADALMRLCSKEEVSFKKSTISSLPARSSIHLPDRSSIHLPDKSAFVTSVEEPDDGFLNWLNQLSGATPLSTGTGTVKTRYTYSSAQSLSATWLVDMFTQWFVSVTGDQK